MAFGTDPHQESRVLMTLTASQLMQDVLPRGHSCLRLHLETVNLGAPLKRFLCALQNLACFFPGILLIDRSACDHLTLVIATLQHHEQLSVTEDRDVCIVRDNDDLPAFFRTSEDWDERVVDE